MPLPEAFRLIAGGLSDPYLSRACRRAAKEVENGARLSESMQSNRWFPPSILPFVTWGENTTALPQAFSSAHELYEGRANSQTTSFMAIVVPLTFLTIVVFAGLSVLSLFMPLVSLITSLTGGGHRAGHEVASNLPYQALLGMFAVLALGVVILLVKTVAFWTRWTVKHHPLEFALSVIGWAIVFLATTALLFYANILLGLFWLFTVPCIVVFIMFQNLRMRQQGLLWMMALASEKQIPLVPAIEAYAAETGGSYGDRVRDFAALLNNGIPLPDALSMVPGLVSLENYPLICAAYESGALSKGLREAAETRNLQHSLWGSLSAKMLYIVGMILIGMSILTFIMIKIVPAFEKIFKDFGTDLPAVTKALMGASRDMLLLWPILALVTLFFFFLFFHCLLRYLGVSVFELPGMGRFMRRKHAADIMQNLALSVENRRPIDAALQTLARCYPIAAIRAKLNRVLTDVRSGAPWEESLRERGLIRQSDFAVLQAASRAGNLPWAMREMADSNRRRLAYRLNVVVQTIFPPVVLCFGTIVMFVVVALFMPLIALIRSLS
jgi:type II secretory pathway component PulF